MSGRRRAPAASEASGDAASGIPARQAAIALVRAAEARRSGLDEAMAGPQMQALAPRDRGFARALAMIVLRRRGEIDAVLDARLDRRPNEAVVDILRIAVAQMLAMDTPVFAVVSTAVRQCERANDTRPFKGLVNAVLRRIDREGILPGDPALNLPDWLRARWEQAYPGQVAALARAGQDEPPTDLSFQEPPDDASVSALDGTLLPGGSVRSGLSGEITDWPGFGEGLWWVQDAAAAIPARLLAVQAGEDVLDLCAAPGGKTLQLAAAGGRVVALDRSEARLRRLRENLARTRLEAEVIAVPAEDWSDKRRFDAVLLDAPCSATGTYRRNPEVLWATRPGDIAKLADVQHRLLDVAAARVRPGGRLVYCVCSLEREEGETQVLAFLRRNPAFRLERAEPAAVGAPEAALCTEGWLRILPSQIEGGMDGFFAALLVREDG